MPMITLATPLIASTVAFAFMLTWAIEHVQGRFSADEVDDTEE